MRLHLPLLLLLVLCTALAFGCRSRDGRAPLPATDASAGGSDAATGHDAGPAPDGAIPDGGTSGDDAGSGVDGGTPPAGECDPVCVATPGAMCCQDCGCGGATVRCEPLCPEGSRWDCELTCCFDTTMRTCQPRD